jgi:hypothetical protein
MNKYYKNKQFKEKALKRATSKYPFNFYAGCWGRKTPKELKEEYDIQLKDHQEWLEKTARGLDKGFRSGFHYYGNTKWYKTNRNRIMRAKTRDVINNNLTEWDEKLYPKFVKTIHWDLT